MLFQHPFLLIAVGALATLTMDIGALLGQRLFQIGGDGPRRTGPDILGRWVGYLARGRTTHRDILLAQPLTAEVPVGFLAHYLIGIALTFVYFLVLAGAGWGSSPWLAVGYGVATSVFAWFLMFPSQGYGVFGARAPEPARLTRASLYNHAIFGLGLAAWSIALGPVR